jgi:hypothetical protein
MDRRQDIEKKQATNKLIRWMSSQVSLGNPDKKKCVRFIEHCKRQGERAREELDFYIGVIAQGERDEGEMQADLDKFMNAFKNPKWLIPRRNRRVEIRNLGRSRMVDWIVLNYPFDEQPTREEALVLSETYASKSELYKDLIDDCMDSLGDLNEEEWKKFLHGDAGFGEENDLCCVFHDVWGEMWDDVLLVSELVK